MRGLQSDGYSGNKEPELSARLYGVHGRSYSRDMLCLSFCSKTMLDFSEFMHCSRVGGSNCIGAVVGWCVGYQQCLVAGRSICACLL